jgi:uncharacterized protein DUF3857
MRRVIRQFFLISLILLIPSWSGSRAAAADWDPVTDAEKNMTSNPLDPGSGAVVLFKRGDMQVERRNTSLWETKIVTYTRIKILTEAGRDAGNVVLEAPKFLRLSKIEGRTILPSGEIIPLDTSKVFRTVSYQSGRDFAMLATSFAFSSVQPGSIIEYQTEQFQDWFFPSPWIFDTRELATLQSVLKVSVAEDLAMAQAPLDTNVNKINFTKGRTNHGLETTYTVQNLRPIRNEPFSVPFYDRAVLVLFNPVEWAVSGRVYPVIKTWDDIGTELMSRYKTANRANKDTVAKAKELTGKLTDPRARSEAIYKYLQQNITSSNLAGVGLDRSPDDLLMQKRGDPDDINLAFYSMLNEAKVDADFILLATKNWQTLVPQFPNLPQFSRAIVRINFKEGPVFADAADASAPFGDLPWFEKGISGMAIKGTKLVPTPILQGSPDDNLSTSKFTIKLGSDWKAEGDAQVELKGTASMDFRGRLIDEAPEKAEEDLTEYFGFGRGDAVVSNLIHPDLKDTSVAFVLKAHVQDRVAPEITAATVLVNPWMGDQFRSPVFKSAQRQSFVQFHGVEKQVTTSTWELAPELGVEKLPGDVKMQGDMADFSHSCTQSQNTVTCTRSYTLKKADMTDPNGYRALKAFFDEVAQHDQEVILLRRQ